MTYARRLLGMLKPTWRSEQKREEQAEAEAATAMAAEEPDFDTGQAHEEQGSDVADEDIDKTRADEDSAIAEPGVWEHYTPTEFKEQCLVEGRFFVCSSS